MGRGFNSRHLHQNILGEFKWQKKKKKENNSLFSLLLLLADIRAAVGDPEGKLMQDELVKHCKRLVHSKEWYKRRVEILVKMQKHMRKPERTLVCDILANGQLLPDKTGKRYGFITTGTEQ